MLIIEGTDNTGKSTLAKDIAAILNWKVVHSPGPLDRSVKMMKWLVDEISSNPKPVVYDRISLISDKVYAPIVRGQETYYVRNPELEVLIKGMIAKIPHLIIFCRPSDKAILNNNGRDQMEGVLENHEELMKSYDNIISEYYNDDRFNVLVYNYEENNKLPLIWALESYLKELREMEENSVLSSVFAKQKELMEKYEHIERDNGFYVPEQFPLDINNKHHQLKIKEFAWRITEELSESIAELGPGREKALKEELADVLHFNSELTIMLGMEREVNDFLQELSKDWLQHVADADFMGPLTSCGLRLYGSITYHLSMACHKLKNKPWKQSHKETNVEEFKKDFLLFWKYYMVMVAKAGMSIDDLIEEYHKKHKINVARQENGY